MKLSTKLSLTATVTRQTHHWVFIDMWLTHWLVVSFWSIVQWVNLSTKLSLTATCGHHACTRSICESKDRLHACNGVRVWLNYSVFTGKFVLCLRFYMEILLKSAVVININGIIVKLAKTEDKLMRIVWFVFPSSQSWVFWRKLINNTHQCVIIVSIAKTHLSALHRELTRWVLQKKLSLMSKLYSFGVSL